MTVFFWHASKLPPSLALTSSPYKLSRVYLMEFVWGSENGKGVKSTPLCSQINSFKDKAEIAWYSKIRQGKQRSSGKIGLLGHSQPVRPNLARHHGWAVVATSGHNHFYRTQRFGVSPWTAVFTLANILDLLALFC